MNGHTKRAGRLYIYSRIFKEPNILSVYAYRLEDNIITLRIGFGRLNMMRRKGMMKHSVCVKHLVQMGPMERIGIWQAGGGKF